MGLKDDLKSEVQAILKTNWQEREGRVVPEATDVSLGNDAVTLDGVVLYADLADSTHLVDTSSNKFAAEVFKSFLVCSCRIIRENNGSITSFDGDRVMAVFIGDYKNSSAVKAALQINYAVKQIVVPEIQSFYNQSRAAFTIGHSVGIDAGKLFVARTGIRGSNDLVWVGSAANWAAKMSALREGNYTSWISKAVFDKIDKPVKLGKNGESMWEQRTWKEKTIYRSHWWWSF